MIFERDLALHCVSSRKLLEASCNACAEFVGSAQETKTPPERAEQWSRFFATGRQSPMRTNFLDMIAGPCKSWIKVRNPKFSAYMRIGTF